MTTERRPRPRTSTGVPPAEGLKRIPLPPLPHFRGVRATSDAPPEAAPATPRAAADSPVPAGRVSGLEMSELLGPDHEGGMARLLETYAPPRTGATGATIMNDLVDEIEKGLERELARAPIELTSGTYRKVLACAGSSEAPRPAPPGVGPTERRTEE